MEEEGGQREARIGGEVDRRLWRCVGQSLGIERSRHGCFRKALFVLFVSREVLFSSSRKKNAPENDDLNGNSWTYAPAFFFLFIYFCFILLDKVLILVH